MNARCAMPLLCATLAGGVGAADLRVDAAYPGGNVVVERIEGNRVFVAPDQRDTEKGRWWFYWNFELTAPPGSTVDVVFTQQNPIGVRGPAISRDHGATWTWMGADGVRASTNKPAAWSFPVVVPDDTNTVRIAFCPQYQRSHFEAWQARHRDDPALRIGELCRSRKGRAVEVIRAGCLDPRKSPGVVLLTARHHCCETMASYALEGLLDAVLADDEPGRRWRANWEVVAVPFVDKDGVEDGDQGKYRSPHDHNRDYNDVPRYPEVAALMQLGGALSNRVVAMLDLHCPHIRGPWNDRVYLVGAESSSHWKRQQAFAAAWERVQEGAIRFRAADCLAFGTAWNTGANYGAGCSSARWARNAFPEARLITGIEIAYADALGAEVNAATARALGRDLARALQVHLSTAP